MVIEDYKEILHKIKTDSITRCPWIDGIVEMVNSELYQDSLFKDVNKFVSYIPNKGIILDFGTGSGIAGVCCASLGYRVEGIDIDDFQIDLESHATMKREQKLLWNRLMENYKNIKFQHYSNNDIPFKDNAFDAVIAYAVIEHIPDAELKRVMGEIKRVLKPDGYIFISYLPRNLAICEYLGKVMHMGCHDRLWGDKEIKDFLIDNQFKILEFEWANFVPQYPSKIINEIYPLLKLIDWLAIHSPLKHFSHDIFR